MKKRRASVWTAVNNTVLGDTDFLGLCALRLQQWFCTFNLFFFFCNPKYTVKRLCISGQIFSDKSLFFFEAAFFTNLTAKGWVGVRWVIQYCGIDNVVLCHDISRISETNASASVWCGALFTCKLIFYTTPNHITSFTADRKLSVPLRTTVRSEVTPLKRGHISPPLDRFCVPRGFHYQRRL